MKISITINNVQHIKRQEIIIDLSANKITCIAGKNSIGKTTLVRAIRNLAVNSTFQETAAPYIFSKESSISYSIDGFSSLIEFTYNKFLNSVDSKQEIPEELKSLINVELSIPHGERFNHFSRLAGIDEELRTKIAIGEYERPEELISFLRMVYQDDRFENLKEATLSKTSCYFILKDANDRFYIREDYFSSGEYFLVNLYKQIKKQKKLIVIDEIDISLDASAQVNLVSILRDFCSKYSVNIVFTTHSLALMKTLIVDELFYMEKDVETDVVKIAPRSYNFIKSVMYGFIGSDKYILTEDECLSDYIKYLLTNCGTTLFYQYQVIYIGGASEVVDLMDRNAKDGFLTTSENTLAVLDGDQEGKQYINGRNDVVLIPFWNIEHEVFQGYKSGDALIPRNVEFGGEKDSKKAKSLFKSLTKRTFEKGALMPEAKIYEYLQSRNPDGVREFTDKIVSFLNP